MMNKTATEEQKFASLKAAAEDKSIEGVSKETSFKVDPFKVEIRPGFNRPVSREHIDNIKESIRGGVKLKPIDVAVERTATKSTIFMVDGEHRMWAVRELIEEYRAGLSSGRDIPEMSAVEFKGGIDEQIAHMLSSGQSLGITPLVQGEKYAELIALNWDVTRIAKRMGKSVTHIENCLMLARANPDVRESVRAGEVAGTVAVGIIREHGSDAGKVIQEALEKAKASGKSKVTKKTVQGAAIPRKLVARFTDSIGTLFNVLPSTMTAHELDIMPDGATVIVEMPAALLAELRAAHDDVLKLREKAAAPATEGANDAAA
jgi:ParB-like chromosome segregation protein Spo0J